MTLKNVDGKLEEAARLVEDLSKDLTDLLSVVRFALPVVGDRVERAKERVSQIGRLLGLEEDR